MNCKQYQEQVKQASETDAEARRTKEMLEVSNYTSLKSPRYLNKKKTFSGVLLNYSCIQKIYEIKFGECKFNSGKSILYLYYF